MFMTKKRKLYLNLILFAAVLLSCMSFMKDVYAPVYSRLSTFRLKTPPNGMTFTKPRTHLLENSCKIPWLEPEEPSIKGYLKKVNHPKCASIWSDVLEQDADGNIYIEETDDIEPKSLRCYMQMISGALRPAANKLTIRGKFALPVNSWFWVNADNFLIRCNGTRSNDSESGLVFKRQFMGRIEKNMLLRVVNGKRPLPPPSQYNFSKLSLSVLALDSTSRSQFVRHMPKTVAQMSKMGFVILNGYNKVADNSNVNLLPIFASPLKESLDYPLLDLDGDLEMARILPYDASVDPDTIEFVWNTMKEKGCESMFNDDIMHVSRGILHYPEKYFQRGFSRKPTDNYHRPFYVDLYKEMDNKWKLCYDGRVLSHEFMDTWYRFTKQTRGNCSFSFNFVTSLTHDNPNNLQIADDYLHEKLSDLEKSESLENTVLIIMGDHGQRIHRSQATFAGRIEERTPLMSIYLPSGFRAQFPVEFQQLIDNTNRFTSNFDIHETLLDLIEKRMGKPRLEGRGISLFEKIPAQRSCLDNNVVETFCLCLMENDPLFKDITMKMSDVSRAITNNMIVYPCLDVETLKCSALKSYSLPAFALAGVRNKADFEKKWKKTTKMKHFYIETNCTISVKDSEEQLTILYRLRHEKGTESYDVTTPPLILKSLKGEKLLEDVC